MFNNSVGLRLTLLNVCPFGEKWYKWVLIVSAMRGYMRGIWEGYERDMRGIWEGYERGMRGELAIIVGKGVLTFIDG